MRERVNDPERLALMLEAIYNIEGFLADVQGEEHFTTDKQLCHAVAYNLQCIGESAYKLSRDFVANHPAIDWEAMEGLRHILVHDYYTANFSQVWQIVVNDLPQLRTWILTHIARQG